MPRGVRIERSGARLQKDEYPHGWWRPRRPATATSYARARLEYERPGAT